MIFMELYHFLQWELTYHITIENKEHSLRIVHEDIFLC